MSTETTIFKIPPEDIGNGNYIHFVNIEEITDEIGSYIDSKIRLITEGNTTTDISLVKKRLRDYLVKKKGSTIEMGAVAEFMIHLYLNQCNFKQEFLFYNLEERSIKKGFDGYYSKDNTEWILESKSGKISTIDITHKKKLSEAYHDLKNKVCDNEGNNPWRNAYHHASQIDVQSANSLRVNIKKLADNFESGIYKNIQNLSIIPASTIFLGNHWEAIDPKKIKEEIIEAFDSKEFNGIQLICVNKKSIDLLEKFLSI
jgi:hypothetical protein